MKEYHKIETLFERDMDGTKKLIEGKFRNPAVELLADCLWVAKEKIDGTNIRVHWDGHTIEIGGRTDKAELHKDLMSYLQRTFCTPEAEQMFEQLFGDKDVYLFGEGYGAGIQKGGGDYRTDKALILFDVCVNGCYLNMASVETIAASFGVPSVPVLAQGTLKHLVDFVKSRPNSLCAINKRTIEGVVAVPYTELRTQQGERVIVKIKCCDFE